MRMTKACRNYQDSEYIRSWLAIQGLDEYISCRTNLCACNLLRNLPNIVVCQS